MNSSASGSRPQILTRLKGDFAVEAAIFIPYLIAILWQYCCAIPSRPVAWTISIALSLVVWFGYAALVESESENAPWQFWLVVGLPLLLIYALRFDFPDISFDVLNYHIFEGERILRG